MHIDTSPRAPDRRELLTVGFLLIAGHIVLWMRYWPLPHYDLNAYLEPGVLLGTLGQLAGPGSQHLDLTLTKAAHFYPPGFALLVGGWVALFGPGLRSLLAYTHVVHAAYLFCLWWLRRARFGCGRGATAVAVASVFPFFAHGRPDLTSLALGAAAWLALPPGSGRVSLGKMARILPSSLLLGSAVLVSPSFGLGSAAAIGTYCLFTIGATMRDRVLALATLVAGSVATFLGVWAVVLSWQGHWEIGPEQFLVNSAIRGRELNTIDLPITRYGLAFIAVPLILLTVVPAVIGVLRRRESPATVWAAALSYLGGFIVWGAVNSQQLIVQHHFSYLARVPLHGTIASRRSPLGRLGLAMASAFVLIHFYFQKNELMYLFTDLEGAYASAAVIDLPPGRMTAVDSPFFPVLYRPGTTLNYELVKANSWARYRDATSASTLALLPPEVRAGPAAPDVLILSALTLVRAGVPDPTQFRYVGDEPLDVPRRSLLGRTIAMPQRPLTPYRFVRVTGG